MQDGEERGAPRLCDLLKRCRRAAGLTQEALAERAGLSVETISLLERGGAQAAPRDHRSVGPRSRPHVPGARGPAGVGSAGRGALCPRTAGRGGASGQLRALRGAQCRSGCPGAPCARRGRAPARSCRGARHRQVAAVERGRRAGRAPGSGGADRWLPPARRSGTLCARGGRAGALSAPAVRAAGAGGVAWLCLAGEAGPRVGGRADRTAAGLDGLAPAGAPAELRGGSALPDQRRRGGRRAAPVG